jgi:hypothetical protein
MATGNFIQDKGYDAAVAITKFRAVKFSAEEVVTPVTAATDVACGVAQVGVTAAEILKGKGVLVRRMGATEMECADGRCKPAVATERVIGVCDEATAAAGERARVTLNLPGNILA